jgi:4'-phosphopantetheinyl transferase
MSAAEFTGWVESSTVPALKPGEIQVWRISLTGQPGTEAGLKELLAPEEIARAASFRFPRDHRRFVIRRTVLRQLLAAYLQSDPRAIRLEIGSHGKPCLADQPEATDLRFSCSHSADLALIALARGVELGVDLEQHHDLMEVEALARNYFSPREIQELTGVPSTCRQKVFFDGWTRKEAFVKAVGLGLTYPLNRFSVSLSLDKPAALLEVADDPSAIKKWAMLALEVRPNCSAALVYESRATGIHYHAWSAALMQKM